MVKEGDAKEIGPPECSDGPSLEMDMSFVLLFVQSISSIKRLLLLNIKRSSLRVCVTPGLRHDLPGDCTALPAS